MARARILCVDDNPRINELNQHVLVEAGFDVVTAESHAEALQEFRSGSFDLIIADLFSPASSDEDFIAEVRSRSPRIPIIVVSGSHNPPPEILQKADVFIQKAYSVHALADAVRELLSRDSLRRIS